MSGTNKSSNVEYYKRVRQVQEWLIQGNTTTDIVQNCISSWGIVERQAYRYLKDAFELFRKQSKREIEQSRAFHIQARMKLYKEALNGKQNKTALDILDSIAKLEALFIQKIDHTTKGKEITTDISHLSYEQLLKIAEQDNTGG